MKVYNEISFGALIILFLSLVSCSNIPEESTVSADFRSEIYHKSNKGIKLIDFKKTNGFEQKVFGQEGYIIEYEAEVESLKDRMVFVSRTNRKRYFKDFKTYDKTPNYVPSLDYELLRFPKNETVRFVGSLVYVKTENGWRKKDNPFVF